VAAADLNRRVVSSRQITPATSPSLRLQIAAEGQGIGPASAADRMTTAGSSTRSPVNRSNRCQTLVARAGPA
jgi:hypothetical protein